MKYYKIEEEVEVVYSDITCPPLDFFITNTNIKQIPIKEFIMDFTLYVYMKYFFSSKFFQKMAEQSEKDYALQLQKEKDSEVVKSYQHSFQKFNFGNTVFEQDETKTRRRSRNNISNKF